MVMKRRWVVANRLIFIIFLAFFLPGDLVYGGSGRHERFEKINPCANAKKISKKLRSQLEGSFWPLPIELEEKKERWANLNSDLVGKFSYNRLTKKDYKKLTEDFAFIRDISAFSQFVELQDLAVSPDQAFKAVIRIFHENNDSSDPPLLEVFIQGAVPSDMLNFGEFPVATVGNFDIDELSSKYLEDAPEILRMRWLRWAPNSRALAFLHFDDELNTRISVFSMGFIKKSGFFRKRVFFQLDTLTIPVACSGAAITGFAWGEDGQSIYYAEASDLEGSIYRYDLTRLKREKVLQDQARFFGFEEIQGRLYLFKYNEMRETAAYGFLDGDEFQPLINDLAGRLHYAAWDPAEELVSVVSQVNHDSTIVQIFSEYNWERTLEPVDGIYIPHDGHFYGAPFLGEGFVVFPVSERGETELEYLNLEQGKTGSIGIMQALLRGCNEVHADRDLLYFRSKVSSLQKPYLEQYVTIRLVPTKDDIAAGFHIQLTPLKVSENGDTLYCQIPRKHYQLTKSKICKANLLYSKIDKRCIGAEEILETKPMSNNREIVLIHNENFTWVLSRGSIYLNIQDRKDTRRIFKKHRSIRVINGHQPYNN